MFFEHYGRYNIGKIWRDDVFPCRVYLRHWLVLIILDCVDSSIFIVQLEEFWESLTYLEPQF